MKNVSNEDLALIAIIKDFADKYPKMTLKRAVEIARDTGKKIESGEVSIKPKTNMISKARREMLELIISRDAVKAGTTRNELAKILGRSNAYIKSMAEWLLSHGYIEQFEIPHGRGRKPIIYKPLKDASGNELASKGVTKRADGVTICPPKYCDGYGINTRF